WANCNRNRCVAARTIAAIGMSRQAAATPVAGLVGPKLERHRMHRVRAARILHEAVRRDGLRASRHHRDANWHRGEGLGR
ncbi:MAG: hypothetical protein KIT32_15910, partial [Rhodocyclaceae bacterium]|nr:hypothetical protein [Rhodocyclaceae bacterium]